MIPKIIHYCWFGSNAIPQEYLDFIAEWHTLHPGWEIVKWDGSNSPVQHPYLANALRTGNWANGSNFIRLWALQHSGGIYLDTDFKLVKPLTSLLEDRCFFGFEEGSAGNDVFWVNNAICGAEKGHPFIQECFQHLTGKFDGSELANLSGPRLTTELLKNNRGLAQYGLQTLGDVRLYPKEYFYPIHYTEVFKLSFLPKYLTPETIGVHVWARTWLDKEMLITIMDDLYQKAHAEEENRSLPSGNLENPASANPATAEIFRELQQVSRSVGNLAYENIFNRNCISHLAAGKQQARDAQHEAENLSRANELAIIALQHQHQLSARDLEAAHKEITQLQENLVRKKLRIRNLKTSLKGLRQEITLGQAALQDLHLTVAEQALIINRLKAVEEATKRENLQLHGEMAAFGQKVSGLKETYAVLRDEISQLESGNQLLAEENADLRRETLALQTLVNELQQQPPILPAEPVAINPDVNAETAQLRAEAAAWENERNQLLATIRQQEENLTAFQAEAQNQNHLLENLRQELSREQDQAWQNQETIGHLNTHNIQLREQVLAAAEGDQLRDKETKRLQNEVKALNQAMDWYKRTYENRRLGGIIKDKLTSKLSAEGPLKELVKGFYKVKKAKTPPSLNKRILCAVVNYNCNENALSLRKNLSRHFDTVIFDSGSKVQHSKFINLGNVYYSGLLNNSYQYAKEKGYDFLFFVCSDVEVSYEAADTMVRNLEQLNLDEIGMYSPASKGRSHIFCKKVYDKGLRSVPFAEGFIFLSAMEVLDQFLPMDLNVNLYGWGLDVTKGYFSRKLNRLCVVDDAVEVYHPESTGYSNDKAEADMWHWMESFDDPAFRNFFEKQIWILRHGHAAKLKVSVIVPCYNQSPYLRETMHSLLMQEYANLEILLVDDGSTDDSAQIAKELAEKFPVIRYFHKPNGGLGNTRNYGLQQATGQLIQFLDGDDTLSNDKLLNQVYAILNQESIEVSYTPYLCFEDGKPENTWTYSRVMLNEDPAMDLIQNWEKDLSIPVHCFLFRREVLKELRFDEELPNHEDWLFHLNVAGLRPKYQFENSGLAFYRVRTNSMARDKELMIKGKRMCLEKAIGSEKFGPEYVAELTNRILEN